MAQTLTDVFNIRVQFPIDLRTVKADMNARNAIEPLQRYEGLTVWVVSDQRKYRLIGGILDSNWVDVTESSGLQNVTVSSASPTGGNPGDIHFKTVTGGFEIWYNNAGSWGSVGSIPTGGGGPSYTPDPSLPNPPTLTYLNTNYPDAAVGDVVYREGTTQVIVATCYTAGEWSYITQNKAQ